MSHVLRDMCTFARQDVTRDAPFSRLDLVSCRNVLIYFSPVLQRSSLKILHYALKPTGYMLLGTSETIGTLSDLFALVDKKTKVYSRKVGTGRLMLDFPIAGAISKTPGAALQVPETTSQAEVMVEADRIVLRKFSPTGVVVNDDMKVLQFRGRTGKYLEPETGEASFNLFRMAREGLLHALRSAIQTARKKDAPVRKPNVRIQHEGGLTTVTLEVIPFHKRSKERHFLVLFEDTGASVPGSRTPFRRKVAGHPEVRRLHQELTAIKQILQATIEELEANNEELKSANAEIQSSNEELQSTNEEMETAREELQSTNEELTTVNEELHNRNGELASLNNDLSNLLASVQLPVVMVDRDLRVRRFTPAAETLLNLIPTDVGRPLLDIKPDVEMPDLEAMLRSVIDRLQVIEQEVRDPKGRSYSMWIRPYRTADHRIDGAVLALADMTVLRESLERSRDLREYAEAIAATVREPLLVLDGELKVMTANGPFYRTFGLSPERTANQPLFEIGSGEWNIPQLGSVLTAELPAEGFTQGLEVDYLLGAPGQKALSINLRRVPGNGQARMFLLAIEDISARRLAEETLRESQDRFSVFTRQAPVGILQNNAEGECIFANAEACRIAGVTPEEALGTGWAKYVHPDDRSLLSSSKEATLRNGEGLTFEFRFQFPDGGTVWAHQVTIRVHDQAGATAGFLSAISDITERKNLEEQLRQAQKMEAIGRLAGGVAHDFNNMLTAISGYASQLLAAVPETGPARKAAEQISKVGDQATVLTRQLLAFSRKQVLRPDYEKLNDVLLDMRDMLLRLLGESIEVILELEPNIGSVVVDAGQIQQVILNLAINARDAMLAGGRLTLTTGRVTLNTPAAQLLGLPPGDYVTLAVTDTGAGIEPEILDRLFEPFFTTKALGAGTGLGLSTVYGIVSKAVEPSG